MDTRPLPGASERPNLAGRTAFCRDRTASVAAEASADDRRAAGYSQADVNDGLRQHARGSRRPDRRPGARLHALRPDGRAGAHRRRARRAAGVSAPTASGHLARIAEARLLAVERQGRHRYYRLASPEVAHAIEALMAVAAAGPRRHARPGRATRRSAPPAPATTTSPAGSAWRSPTDSLARGQSRSRTRATGRPRHGRRRAFLSARLGVDLAAGGRRPVCRTCLDWSERRPHLAGRLGAALCRRALELGWIERARDGRAVAVTPAGRRGFAEVFGIASP